MKVYAVERPYSLTFANGHSYLLSSVEAQRLLDEYPVVTASRNRVVLQGHNTDVASARTTLRPATLGGGPAFVIERKRA